MGEVVSTVTDVLGGGSRPEVDRSAARNFQPIDISAGGITTNLSDNQIGVSTSGRRQGLVSNISDLLRDQAGEISGLREQVEPGFGRLTEARVRAVDRGRRRAIGNLRENLSRRRVLGSSFAQDALARAESEFAGQEEEARAQSFLEELDTTRRLVNEEFQLRQQSFQNALNEMNFQTEVATELATQATSALQANAAVQTEAALENQRQALGVSKSILKTAASLAGGPGGGGPASG